jgi:predicted ribosomally synthesized peptide with SipW-like signal peptide
MRKSKMFLIPAICAISGALLAGVLNISGTLSYMTDKDDATNITTIGENEIEIKERFIPPDELVPGENAYEKDIQILNTGDIPCYVRVFVDFSDNDVRNASTLSSDGTTYYSMSEFKNHLPSGWTYIGDAGNALSPYFYYTSAIEPGESTNSLVKMIKTTFKNKEAIEDYDVLVSAESVQVLDKNGDPFNGDNAWQQAWQEYLERGEE